MIKIYKEAFKILQTIISAYDKNIKVFLRCDGNEVAFFVLHDLYTFKLVLNSEFKEPFNYEINHEILKRVKRFEDPDISIYFIDKKYLQFSNDNEKIKVSVVKTDEKISDIEILLPLIKLREFDIALVNFDYSLDSNFLITPIITTIVQFTEIKYLYFENIINNDVETKGWQFRLSPFTARILKILYNKDIKVCFASNILYLFDEKNNWFFELKTYFYNGIDFKRSNYNTQIEVKTKNCIEAFESNSFLMKEELDNFVNLNFKKEGVINVNSRLGNTLYAESNIYGKKFTEYDDITLKWSKYIMFWTKGLIRTKIENIKIQTDSKTICFQQEQPNKNMICIISCLTTN